MSNPSFTAFAQEEAVAYTRTGGKITASESATSESNISYEHALEIAKNIAYKQALEIAEYNASIEDKINNHSIQMS